MCVCVGVCDGVCVGACVGVHLFMCICGVWCVFVRMYLFVGMCGVCSFGHLYFLYSPNFLFLGAGLH